MKESSVSKEIIFAVPGSKVYISKYYNNRVNSFLNISLTGKKCELMCSHCKARLLSDMLDINSTDFVFPDASKPKENRVMEIILRYQNKGDEAKGRQTSVNGVLISGGFDSRGRLPLDARILPELKEVKNKYGREMKVFMHLGFTDRQTAESLYA
jgi:uncharacterized radical SAM superfamily protein